MRPERDDIGAPVFPGRIDWLNADEPPDMAALTAVGPVLVHFFDFAQLNSVRSLPYLLEWRRRYEPLGLTMLGIHSPRFRFTGEAAAIEAGVERLGIEHPVADDSRYAIWHDYGLSGWPSLFLWGRGGALQWVHFGEGEYRETEEAIQDALRAEDVTVKLPAPMEPLRATDAPGVLVQPPTPEYFPGGGPADGWEPTVGDEEIALDYSAGGAWIVADGAGSLTVAVDDEQPRLIEPFPPGLHQIASHPGHESHRLVVRAAEGVRVWAISFEPGV